VLSFEVPQVLPPEHAALIEVVPGSDTQAVSHSESFDKTGWENQIEMGFPVGILQNVMN
jgi:hypothetical protein